MSAVAEMQRYRVYLLRLWLAAGDTRRPIWRAALEDARTGERLGFADIARLCQFLETQTAPPAECDPEPSESDP